MPTIYFGGDALPAANNASQYTGETNLDTLDEVGFRIAFFEWVTQCWMHDEHVPNDAESLAKFDLDALIPWFRRDFNSGGWKRMRAGRGASAEEYVLFLQLVNRKPCVLVLSRQQPQQPLVRVRRKMMMSEAQIGACLISRLAAVKQGPQPTAGAAPLMLYDGRVGHVITVRAIDDTKEWISYDDPTWPGGKSMLCEGENAAGVRAFHLGRPEVGEWVVHVTQLPRLIFGIPIARSEVPIWTRRAGQWDGLFRKRYGRLFGEVPPEDEPGI